MPNSIAMIALLGWPFVVIALFVYLDLRRAVIWSLLGGFLLLPSKIGFDLPGIPALDKISIPNIMVLLMAMIMAWRLFRPLPESAWAKVLLFMLIAAPFFTVLTNMDPIPVAGLGGLPGTRIYDAVSAVGSAIIFLVPFLVGRSLFRTVEAQREILAALLVAGLAYSVLMLIEIRLSPQLHIWVYGYFPHSFAQQARGGGFRPVVFLQHGLWVAFFAMFVTISAAILWRSAAESARGFYLYATGYLAVILALCRSLGSLIYAIFLLPVVLFTSVRTQMTIALVLVSIALAYPALRGAGVVPLDRILETARSISVERAQSLGYRFKNEEMLLDRANERPVFGWGGWGRNRVYDEDSGKDISITDGLWVIKIGTSGWLGFLAFFGLLGWPVLALWRAGRRAQAPPLSPITSGLCLLLAINMIELLVNSTLPPLTWLISGSLLGYAESLKQGTAEAGEAPGPASARPPQRRRTVI
ncbi:hypothetical protein KHP62_20245 [Rhodobacteraceae bacterium NNCM2]|nr:hypothetical protein [Coraliihabitans acroporae]